MRVPSVVGLGRRHLEGGGHPQSMVPSAKFTLASGRVDIPENQF